MFKKKKCKNCEEKISEDYNFCPYCRIQIRGPEDSNEDWGMLGRNDLDILNGVKMPLGFNTLFNSVLKNLNKQFSQIDDEMVRQNSKKDKLKKSGISISISTSHGKPPEIKIKSFGNSPDKNHVKENNELFLKQFNRKEVEKFSMLPKKEPSAEIRRLADKIIYEIKIPGVKSLDDVSINQLENSIEIKALTKAKAYSKIIPINLPISKYNLEKGKLILELDARD